MFRCVLCVVCMMLVKGTGSISDALQEEAAVAFCSFFSVPLTYEDKTGRGNRLKQILAVSR